ncbi:hypothetical protein BHE74_00008839 [Ensete ventricosum]|nr:hypothetical protein BHE74_00008839 [Ensete ventricosum]
MGREKVEEEEDEGRRGGNQRGCGGDAGGHQFLDRSKVRILLCDNDPKSSQEVLQLLYKCSYQGMALWSLPLHIRHTQAALLDPCFSIKAFDIIRFLFLLISFLVMSAQDEVSVVVKCLRLGAADYLVKPLRMNELLNLWTHMWRRRCMVVLDMSFLYFYYLRHV